MNICNGPWSYIITIPPIIWLQNILIWQKCKKQALNWTLLSGIQILTIQIMDTIKSRFWAPGIQIVIFFRTEQFVKRFNTLYTIWWRHLREFPSLKEFTAQLSKREPGFGHCKIEDSTKKCKSFKISCKAQ